VSKPSFHEAYTAQEKIQPGSEKSFAIVMMIAPIVIGAIIYLFKSYFPVWLLTVSVFFALLLLLAPKALKPLNLLWFKFGLLLHGLVSPLIMGLVFFVVVTPTGLIRTLFGKDSLQLKFDPERTSYWEARDPKGPEPDSIKNQF